MVSAGGAAIHPGPPAIVIPDEIRAAIVAHRDMVVLMRDRVRQQIDDKKTLDQIVASKPTADHDERVGNAPASADRFIGQLYAELGGK